ncbi:MAG TPA: DUF488 domain-containing protein [Burkholderiaceae bacterium]|nr:DUF488 domain-containing protein [Burkholderiaceae bacterium]
MTQLPGNRKALDNSREQTRFHTVGHSNLDLSDFIALLGKASIDMVVDVRRYPGSRAFPQYNQQRLADALRQAGMQYCHLSGLAGRRKKQGMDPDINGAWKNQSFHNYADYALGEAFQDDLHKLVRLGKTHQVAIMCAEGVWWRCHRRIITDYLLASEHAVNHIIGSSMEPARLTDFARIGPAGSVTYPVSASVPD